MTHVNTGVDLALTDYVTDVSNKKSHHSAGPYVGMFVHILGRRLCNSGTWPHSRLLFFSKVVTAL